MKLPMPRTEVIEELVRVANAAMVEKADGVTADEVLSAYFSMAQGGIAYALEHGANPEALREPIATLYAMLPPLEGTRH